MAELTDGRILVLEHKGEVYATNDDSKEKCNVGELWEEKSNGKAIFLMAVFEKGKPGLFEQIAAKIGRLCKYSGGKFDLANRSETTPARSRSRRTTHAALLSCHR